MFYHQTQNNVRGNYRIDLEAGINENIIVEANSAGEANERFEKITSPFQGYCECCGHRFHSNFYDECKDANDNDGKIYPHIFGSEIWKNTSRKFSIHYLDGRIEDNSNFNNDTSAGE